MNPVVGSLLEEFSNDNSLKSLAQDVRFEHFVNFSIVHPKLPESFDYTLIHTGEGEFGVDGVAVIINDRLIEDEEMAKDVIENAHSIEVEIVFVQAKMGESFKSGEVLKFLTAVKVFFNTELDPGNVVNNIEKLIEARKIFACVMENSNKCKKNLPKLSLNYVTTGVWENDDLIESMFEASKKEIDQRSLFSSIEWMAAGAKKIRTKYLHTKNSISVTFDASKNLILPVIPKSSESYLVLVSNKELEKIITDEDGGIRKNLFFENIRDYNPLSKVNNSIKETLLSKEAIEFPFKNNGITIVTKSFHRVGDNFTIEDFQIVNGCQTSHVVHECSGEVEDEFFIPAKIICTDDEELTERIIIASNRQNEVTDEMFWSLKQIHKDFEIFFKSKSDDQALYYERRSGQYNTSDVEKVRIVSKDGLLKAYASMFLEEPNKVGRHYGDLVPLVGGKIFKEGDKPHSYYSAAYASFRLEWLFRNNRIDKKYKPFRHLMLMASRLIVEKEENLQNSKKVSEAYCNKIDKRMVKVDKSIDLFMKSVSHIESALAALGYEDDTTRRVAKMRDVKDKVREIICSG